MQPINTQTQLPEVGKYVLVHYNGDNWKDSSDQEGCCWDVAKLALDRNAFSMYGISTFEWQTFGAMRFRLDEIDYWTDLPVGQPGQAPPAPSPQAGATVGG